MEDEGGAAAAVERRRLRVIGDDGVLAAVAGGRQRGHGRQHSRRGILQMNP
jgi:hypothetical protein